MCAALEASAFDARVALFDENAALGGQLVKQTHKYFGTHEHYSGYRGYEIAALLQEKVESSSIEVFTGARVWSMEENNTLWVTHSAFSGSVKAKAIVAACGAREKTLCFPGWTLPGVLYAGALQTLVNLWGVTPGNRVFIVGSGNVGLIVAYQLIQAGLTVVAIIEKRDMIGGFLVHADTLRRLGIPILLNAEVVEARGADHLEGCTIMASERTMEFEVDILCIAAGMSPQIELLRSAGCMLKNAPSLGGYCPSHDEWMKVTGRDVFVCGDICGIEEASIAMEEGRLAALSALRPIMRGSNSTIDERILQRCATLKELRTAEK
jgi:sarcosine oxidase, subunit alpha